MRKQTFFCILVLAFLCTAGQAGAVDAGRDLPPSAAGVATSFSTTASHPHLWLTPADVTRINAWADSESWAANARTGVINNADAWPESFTETYYLSEWALPPEGGQWVSSYICPQGGADLIYEGPGRHICPLDGQVYSGWPYEQVIYGRMHDDLGRAANTLGLAYQLSGETRYAQAAAEILLAYANAYLNYPYHDRYDNPNAPSGGRVTAQTLNEAGWLIQIASAYDLIADSGVLSAAQRSHIEEDLLRAAVVTINRNPVGKNNWQSWHNAAIGAVGFTLEDPQLIAQAIEDPLNGFEYQMQASVSTDGFWYEGSLGYHLYALQAHCYLAEMAARSGIDLYANPALRKMFTAPLRFAMPDLTLPAFNDSGPIKLINYDSLYEAAYRQYGDAELALPLGRRSRGRYALLWGAQTVPEPTAPRIESTLFADAGYAVLRNNEREYPLYLAFDFGPHGGWHGHYDKLGFVSFARNTLMGLDPGTQSYADPGHDTWDKVTVAHNTIVVDEQSQAEASGALHRYVALPGLSVAAADAGDAYTTTALLRTLIVGSDYVLDRYHAQARDGQSHKLDWVYHNPGALTTTLALEEYTGLLPLNGYQYLSDVRATTTPADWQAHFAAEQDFNRPYGSFWPNAEGITATFSYNADQAFDGSSSGKLTYDFSSVSGYVLYSAPLSEPDNEMPDGLHMAFYGDNSGNKLTLRLYDNNDERFATTIGPLDWSGWRVISVTGVLSWSHFLGDGIFDLPVKQIGVDITAQDGAAPTGTLYIDDLFLLYSGEKRLVEDFEIPAQQLDLWMVGQPGTTVVRGNGIGLGLDITRAIPFVMARRTAQDATFAALMAPRGLTPTITGFAAVPNDAVASDEASAFVVTATTYTDRLVAVADGAPGVQRTFGETSCDGEVCLVRRARDGAPMRLILAGGTQLQDGGISLLHSASLPDSIQIDYDGATLRIQKTGAIRQAVYIWGPEITGVQVNGSPRAFTREGDYVVLAAEHLIWLPLILR